MEEALKQYERLLERGPNRLYSTQSAELRVRLGVELAAAGRMEEARIAIRRGQGELLALAGATDPGLRAVYLAARYLIDVPLPEWRRPDEALQLALRADGMQPNDPMTLEVLAKAYALGGTREQALAALERYKAVVPKGSDTAKQQVRELSAEIEKGLMDRGK
jgi:tetratricopeptide (TPR) repeat protein